MEAAIIATAEQIKPHEAENQFNSIVDAAVNDYKATMDGIIDNGKWFEIELMTNFNEFFNACIDIKKKEAVELAQMDKNVAATAADGESNTSPPPGKKSRK